MQNMMIPLLTHFIEKKKIDPQDIKTVLLKAFDLLFQAASKTYGVNLSSKLYETASSNVTKTTLNNGVLWEMQTIRGRNTTTHSIETVEGSVVAKLFGKESQVNSVHRQSIKDLAPNFRVTAVDPRDQTIEAIESIDEHRIIGLQWHPEFLVNEEDGNLELFEYLLNEL